MACKIIYERNDDGTVNVNKVNQVKAPNGERSLLFDTIKGFIKNDDSKALDHYYLTQTESFNKWFKDSPFIDRNNEPITEIVEGNMVVNNGYETKLLVKQSVININQVNHKLKAVDILLSDKAKQVFEKGKKNNWALDKILTELQIPKEQKQLVLNIASSLPQDNLITSKDLREQIALELASKYSYTVEINTTKELPTQEDIQNLREEFGFDEEEAIEESKKFRDPTKNTEYYSNLTVPGGTNYTENEIATPAITPIIKGHAQFSTDNGIGWFRSDDQRPFTGFLEDLIASGTIKKVPCG